LKSSLSESEKSAFDTPSARIRVQLDIFGDSSFHHPRVFVPCDLYRPTGNEGAEGAPGSSSANAGTGISEISSKDYL
jgi:hypothetical protein